MNTATTLGARRLVMAVWGALLLAAALCLLAPAAAHAADYNGLEITAKNGTVQQGTDGQITLAQGGEYVISGKWTGQLKGVDWNNPKAVVNVPAGADVTLDGATIDVGAVDYACAFSIGGGVR